MLLAALLCFALIVSVSHGAKACTAPADTAPEQVTDHADAPAFQIAAGEVTSGESEAVLQLKKSFLPSLFQTLLTKLYPPQLNTVILLYAHPFSDSDCGKHSSLSKGP